MTQFLHDRLLDAFASALATALGQPIEAIRAQVKPAEPEHGDLAFPTFPLAKQLRKAPPAIAAELAGKLAVPGLVIAAAGPYVNARFEPRAFMEGVLAEARGAGVGYGSTTDGSGKTVFIDAGFDWRGAGCSMCLAMNDDKLAPQERCASTSNRNFEGRQGAGGRTHLVSPQMAAAAAIEGHFVDIREWV